jgi:DNA replication and repair protein RecF
MRYAKALRSRNALLKQSMVDLVQLDGFTQELVLAGEALIAARRDFVPTLAPKVHAAFQKIASERDELTLDYHPGVSGDFAVALAQSRNRERVMKTTVVGPHRDDLTLRVNERAAGPFTSEGQKRTLAIALKLAQAEHLARVHGTPPLLLIDDVMGELDARRRSAFVPLLQESFRAGGQVFMTCTEENWPRQLGCDLIRWRVQQGRLSPWDGGPGGV